jgi:hypothetical protein
VQFRRQQRTCSSLIFLLYGSDHRKSRSNRTKPMVVVASQHTVILTTKLPLCTVCKSDQWETESLFRPAFPDILIGQKTGFVGRLSALRAEFFDEITVISTALPWDFYFFKLTQPLTVSTVQYSEKEKGGKPDRKPYPPSLWFKKSIQKPQVWDTETSTKSYEFGFGRNERIHQRNSHSTPNNLCMMRRDFHIATNTEFIQCLSKLHR